MLRDIFRLSPALELQPAIRVTPPLPKGGRTPRRHTGRSPHIASLCAALLFLAITLAARAADPAFLNRARIEIKGPSADFAGARLEASNVSRTDGYITLAELKQPTPENGWAELRFENTRLYRFIRFSLPSTSPTKVGKLELYSGDHLLAGDGGVFHPFVPGQDEVDERAIGYDLFATATAARPNFNPAGPELDQPSDITLTGPKGAIIRYTLDGALPTAANGLVYSQPIHIDKLTTISAIASVPDRAPSLPVTVTYLLRGQQRKALSSAHVGNSLTGTTGQFFRFARTAGYDHQQIAFLRPGALTRELWALADGTYKADKLAAAKEAQARGRGSASWDEYWSNVGPVDLITLQPRDFDLEKELAAEVNFINLFRQKSPDLQPWLYCEWVELKRQRPSDRGEVPSYQMAKTFPALTWEESMGAMLLYMEELQHRLIPQLKGGKKPRIIPAALAMGWIKNKIDRGQFPGAKPGSFYPLLFNDQVHPADGPVHGSANGAFLVDLTWYSAFYRETPENRVLPIETTFTPEQVRLVAQLAWDVIKNYPDCGVYEEGSTPCAKPQITSDEKTITLNSATPGAWFRYTLDGTTPTRTRGYVYCGAITNQPGITLKAIAYKSGMADSEVAAQ